MSRKRSKKTLVHDTIETVPPIARVGSNAMFWVLLILATVFSLFFTAPEAHTHYGFLEWLVPAAISAISLFKGGKGGGGGNPGSLDDLIGKQSEHATETMKQGKDLLGQSQEVFKDPLEYFQKLLSGDRNEAFSAVAPEANRVVDQYDAARRSIAEMAPRGGGRTAALARQPSDVAGVISDLITKARRDAAYGVSDIASELGRMGISLESLGTGAGSDAISALLSKREQDHRTWGDLGLGIGSIIASLILNNSGSKG